MSRGCFGTTIAAVSGSLRCLQGICAIKDNESKVLQ